MKASASGRPTRSVLAAGALVLALGALSSPVRADTGLPEKSPEALGLSASRLERVPAMLGREVDARRYSGAVWLVARDGSIAAHGAVGWSNVQGRMAMGEDTVFRLFSMSKLVTTVTALTLLEEGRIGLDDPVERYLPELANRKVLTGGTADAPLLEPANGPITIRELLTHTSGLTYEFSAAEPLRTIWARAHMWSSASLRDFVGRVAALPLAHQPGAHWTYGVNTDVLGAVIEVVTGQDLETAMRRRVLDPLGMGHTTFRPGADTLPRLAIVYHRTPGGALEEDAELTARGTTAFPSGGGGLLSTLADCARFGQMLLNGGELGGVRVLSRKTVELMTSDQIAGLTAMPGSWKPPAFGFGVRVRTADAGSAGALGSPGEFGWEGAACTYMSADPKERLLLIVLLQHSPYDQDAILEKFADTAYQALE
jgi:CubicO group peptidase (beta-lactamase class C family)